MALHALRVFRDSLFLLASPYLTSVLSTRLRRHGTVVRRRRELRYRQRRGDAPLFAKHESAVVRVASLVSGISRLLPLVKVGRRWRLSDDRKVVMISTAAAAGTTTTTTRRCVRHDVLHSRGGDLVRGRRAEPGQGAGDT